jgi:hypothetical protein
MKNDLFVYSLGTSLAYKFWLISFPVKRGTEASLKFLGCLVMTGAMGTKILAACRCLRHSDSRFGNTY